MKKILIGCIIASTLLAKIPLAQQTEGLPLGEYELHIGPRPSAPYPAMQNYNPGLDSQGQGPDYPVQVSRHHIIPFNVLRDFYNRLARDDLLPRVSGFFNVFANNLAYYARSNLMDCNRLGYDVIYAGNLALAQGMGLAKGSISSDVLPPGFDTFEEFYTWLPGNLFIGPDNRSDDPSSGFEENAVIVVGTERFNILQRTYSNMLRFNNGDNNPQLLRSISSDLSVIAQRRTIYGLDSRHWLFSNGKYRLRRQHEFLKEDQQKPLEEFSTLSEDKCENMAPTLLGIISHFTFDD